MSETSEISEVEAGGDGRERCGWHGLDAGYIRYHDEEWGRPTGDDDRLFEKLCLEGFQSGLSWLTILRKRDAFRDVFHGFSIDRVAAMDDNDIERLLEDARIIRHRGKIASVINNAGRAKEVQAEFGSLAAFLWSFEPKASERPAEVTTDYLCANTSTPASTALSKALRKRGFSFVGPTTIYAFMQSMGFVNDHLEGCFCRPECEADRKAFKRPR